MLFLLLLLCSCASVEEHKVQQVVPVAVVQSCPAAEVQNRPERPELATSKITAGSSNSEVVKAYLADLLAVIGYSKQLETSLDSCR